MSEAVKRYSVFIGFEHGEQQMILASDHDRIVSALTEAGVRMQAERDKWQQEAIRIAVAVCALGKMEFDQLTDDSKLIEVMSVIREAIQERDTLRAEVERLEHDLEIREEERKSLCGMIDGQNVRIAQHLEQIERLRKDAELLEARCNTLTQTLSEVDYERETHHYTAEQLQDLLKEAGDELKELKESVGYRAHTIGVIQRIDAALEVSR